MTTISAKVIAASVSQTGAKIATLQLRYPRVIHAEVMTHRAFSRNASSSRAVPVERMIQDVVDDPFVPLHWGKNQPGMQAREECNAPVIVNDDGQRVDFSREAAWRDAMLAAVRHARAFADAGYHKQLVNRLLEPFAHINVVVTATDWDNFLGLRDHPDAEPHIAILAREVRKALDGAEYNLAFDGRWHLPYVDEYDFDYLYERLGWDWNEHLLAMQKLSAARCARVSYLTQDGRTPTLAEDLALYDRLTSSRPMHASPLEHQATPRDGRTANFNGWASLRSMVEAA